MLVFDFRLDGLNFSTITVSKGDILLGQYIQ